MDMHSDILNRKWKNYFNWTVVYPLILFCASILLVLFAVLLSFTTLLTNDLNSMMAIPFVALVMAMTGAMTLGFFVCAVGVFVYLFWFIIASDNLFKSLNINRIAGNLLNLTGLFILPGLSFLILPIFFWIKMRDYWNNKGVNASWRAVV